MSAFTAVLTAAGSAAVLAAVQSGSGAVALTHMALGWGNAAGNPGYVPTGNELALKREFLRTPIGNGSVVDANTIIVQALFPAPQPQTGAAWELGLFTANGTLFAVVSRTDAPITWVGAVDDIIVPATIALANLPAGSVTWTASGASVDIMLDEPIADLAASIIALQSAVVTLREGLAPVVAAPNQIAALTAALNALETRLQTGLATVAAFPPRPFEIYVDPVNGNDATISPVGPFATLTRAVDAVPAYGVATIYLSSDVLVSADVNVENKRLTFRRAPGVTSLPKISFAVSSSAPFTSKSFVCNGWADFIFTACELVVPLIPLTNPLSPAMFDECVFKAGPRSVATTAALIDCALKVSPIWGNHEAALFLDDHVFKLVRRNVTFTGVSYGFTVALGNIRDVGRTDGLAYRSWPKYGRDMHADPIESTTVTPNIRSQLT